MPIEYPRITFIRKKTCILLFYSLIPQTATHVLFQKTNKSTCSGERRECGFHWSSKTVETRRGNIMLAIRAFRHPVSETMCITGYSQKVGARLFEKEGKLIQNTPEQTYTGYSVCPEARPSADGQGEYAGD